MSIESVMPSNHFILCCPLLLLPSIFPSIRVFSNGLALHIRWPQYWSFSFSNSPSNDTSGLISFRIYWFDLFAVQETLKSLLPHHSLKASTLNFRKQIIEITCTLEITIQFIWADSIFSQDAFAIIRKKAVFFKRCIFKQGKKRKKWHELWGIWQSHTLIRQLVGVGELVRLLPIYIFKSS